ncbi:hypothetical protein M514_13787 [Trichuris suis]|uniref:Uncharacterized protein n=1 Tax=Trichuris suis TaxID=68888 RepID=A0A085MS35_9BILA|nr:hypothetical protein M514_13787 [Trichuris suis]
MQPPVVGTSGKDANSVIITFENVKPKWMRKLPFLMEKNWNPPDVRKREKKNSCKEDGKTNETLVALLLKCWNGGWMKKEEDQQKEVNRTIECDDSHSGPVSIRLINPRIEYHGYGIHRCSICD